MGVLQGIARRHGRAFLYTAGFSALLGAAGGLYLRNTVLKPQDFPDRSFPKDGQRYRADQDPLIKPSPQWGPPKLSVPSWLPWGQHKSQSEVPYREAATRLSSQPQFQRINFDPDRGTVHPSWHGNGLGGVNVQVAQQKRILADLLEAPESAALVSGPGIPADRSYVMFSLAKPGQQPATYAVGVNQGGEIMDVKVQAAPEGQFQQVASHTEEIPSVQRKLSESLQPYFDQQYTIATPPPASP